MAGWIKFILISLVGIVSLGLAIPHVMAAPATPSADVRFPTQPYSSDRHPLEIEIAPELTNPAEIPLSEANQPESTSPLTWFKETLITTDPAKPELKDVNTTVEQWLSSIKRFFNGS